MVDFNRASFLSCFADVVRIGNDGPQDLSATRSAPATAPDDAPKAPEPPDDKADASPQQFCLRWNNYQANLTTVFDQLLQSESFVDVTLACDGHSLKAHKMVLSACSPYFQTLFFENPCQHPIVIMRDIKWPELKAAVEFMYKGEINVSQEQIGPLLRVAESLKIRGLADVNGDRDAAVAPPLSGEPEGSPDSQLPAKKRSPSSQPQPAQQQQPQPAPQQQGAQQQQQPSSQQQQQRRDDGAPIIKARRRQHQGSVGGGRSPVESPPRGALLPAPNVTNATQSLPPVPVLPALPPLPLVAPLPMHTDDMEIKPGIAEMIREEERLSSDEGGRSTSETASLCNEIYMAKLLESSQAWLGASTSSLADYPGNLAKPKIPTWNQEQLQMAIHMVVTQRMRFTQAAAKYNIPKGTLYDNILGKSKRMHVLEEAGLTSSEEKKVLDYCCDVSKMPHNRRTKRPLSDVLIYVEKLRRLRDPLFTFTGNSGFRWWWAFCKKHAIVSLYFTPMTQLSPNSNNITPISPTCSPIQVDLDSPA